MKKHQWGGEREREKPPRKSRAVREWYPERIMTKIRQQKIKIGHVDEILNSEPITVVLIWIPQDADFIDYETWCSWN